MRCREAMGPLNRWYCSEFHGRDIRGPETLWNYYHRSVQGCLRALSPGVQPHVLRAAYSIAG